MSQEREEEQKGRTLLTPAMPPLLAITARRSVMDEKPKMRLASCSSTDMLRENCVPFFVYAVRKQ